MNKKIVYKKLMMAAEPMGAQLNNVVKEHLQSEGYDVIDYVPIVLKTTTTK